MNWVSYMTGVITVLIGYALFSSGQNEELDLEEEEFGSSILDNDGTGRYVTLSCQTCRKLKKHKEIRPNVFQCAKCKRHIDIS
jgi:hypothetical protein